MAMRDSLKNKSMLYYQFADGNGNIEVRWDSIDMTEKRHTYHVRIRTSGDMWTQVYDDTEVRSGSGDPVSLPRALACVLSFLMAFSESRRYGDPDSDNWNLFPDHLAMWAEGMYDEFSMALEEIEPQQ